jgi:hypothetical protein
MTEIHDGRTADDLLAGSPERKLTCIGHLYLLA